MTTNCPTKMKDGENELHHWLTGMADDFFRDFSEVEREKVFDKIAVKAKDQLFHEGSWYVDYKRL
jgi:hypothetical protein